MIWFGIFLSALSGVLIANLEAWAVIPLVLVVIIGKRRSKKVWLLFLATFTIFLLLCLSTKIYFKTNEIYGFVYKSFDKYCLVISFQGRYYVSADKLCEVGDIIRFQGESKELSFRHYEQAFDFESYLSSFGVSKEFVSKSSSYIIRFPLRSLAFKNTILNNVDSQVRSIVSSFVFGDVSEISSQNENFATSGLLSVFRLSGIHISFTFALIEKYWKRKRELKKIYPYELCFVLLLLFLSNYRLAIFRIVLTRIIRMCCPKIKDKVEIDSFCGLILLTINPNIYSQASFYLVFPMLFILSFSKSAFKRINPIGRGLFVSLTLYLYFLPYTIATNYSVSPLGFLIRLVALPLGHLGFVTSFLSLLPFGGLTKPVLLGLSQVMEYLNNLSVSLIVGKMSVWYIVIIYVLIFISLYALELNQRKITLIGYVSVLILVFIRAIPISIPTYEVHFIDVGQGDATLVRDGNYNYLIDTGGNVYTDLATQSLIPYFHSLRINKIDKVYISHGDYDHSGALESLQDNFKVGEVFYNCGDERIIDLNNYKKDTDDLNYSSSVFYFTLKDTRFLVMGDAPIEIENYIMRDNKDLKADVLKVGHHGSKTSSSYEFLSTIDPNIAVISCGLNNYYGHPNSVVITYLDALNITVHRTDLEGTYVYKV